MKVKFVIPVINTEEGKYDYNGRDFTANDYFGMIQARANQTRCIMDKFAYNYSNGYGIQSLMGSSSVRNLYDGNNVNLNKETVFDYSESEALIFDGDGNEMIIDDFYDLLKQGKKFLLKVNINPNSLENDAESELRTWIDDSDKVLKDRTLDERTMLLSLPLRNFIIDTAFDSDDDSLPIFHILGCKIIQIYPKKESNFDFYFAIMCEQIKKQ